MHWLPVIITSALLLSSCAINSGTISSDDTAEREKSDYTFRAAQWADSIVNLMTDTQLIGQLIMPAIYAQSDSATLKQLSRYAESMSIGGVMLLKGDTASASILADKLSQLSSCHPLIAIDAEWGLGMRLKDALSYPSFPNLGTFMSERQMYDYGYDLGLQASRLGINVIFGPVLDVASNPRSIMKRRSLGSNPVSVAELGVAYAHGIEDASVISVAKHFPGLGATTIDSHHSLPRRDADRVSLDSIDLYPFRHYVENNLSGIMVGHVAVSALDTVVRSAALSPVVVNELLRSELGFRGLVFTDAMNMGGVGHNAEPEVDAILAGADILVAPADVKKTFQSLDRAMNNGRLPRNIIIKKVWRILYFKYKISMASKKRRS